MKKKILFLITKSNFGGAQRYVFNLAKSLSKDKFEVVVALGGGGELRDRLSEENIKIVQIETLERDINISNEIKVLKRLITLIRKESPDLIHLNSSKIAGLGVLAGIFTNIFSSKKKKIILTANGCDFN